jgi:hypothetical protein
VAFVVVFPVGVSNCENCAALAAAPTGSIRSAIRGPEKALRTTFLLRGVARFARSTPRKNLSS